MAKVCYKNVHIGIRFRCLHGITTNKLTNLMLSELVIFPQRKDLVGDVSLRDRTNDIHHCDRTYILFVVIILSASGRDIHHQTFE